MDVLNTTSAIEVTTFSSSRINHVSKIVFTWYDYSFFSAMLILSALIGIYFGCFGKKQTTADEYLLGGKTMKVIPIAFSLVASTISGIALLSIPADVYRFGATYWFSSFAVIAPSIITSYVYLPVFYNLQLTSTYEYLKLRFDTRIRLFASFLFGLAIFLYLPIVIYVPALALSQATEINIHFITPLVCSVCIFYTTIGGLKAVVWTDMLQFSVTIGAVIAVIYLGVKDAGGLVQVFELSTKGHLLDVDFDITPTKRDTFWAIMIGWSMSNLAHLGISQNYVQKFLSLPTIEDAKKSVIIYLIGIVVIKSSCVLTGLIMYAKYYKCDPITTGDVLKPDQILPYYVLDVAGKIPGLPGLFIAGVFCAALSTLSAVMNCVAGTIYEDFVSRYMPADISQKRVSNILKLIVIITGVVSTSLVAIVDKLGSLLPLAISFGSVTSGPLLGIFTLGMLFPKANSKGAFYGGVSSILFMFWILIGAQIYRSKGMIINVPKPVSTDGCDFDFVMKNSTILDQPEEVFFLYRITHYYYSMLGACVGITVGMIVSWFTIDKNAPPVDKKLLSPVVHFLLKEKKHEVNYYSIDKALHIVVSTELNKK